MSLFLTVNVSSARDGFMAVVGVGVRLQALLQFESSSSQFGT